LGSGSGELFDASDNFEHPLDQIARKNKCSSDLVFWALRYELPEHREPEHLDKVKGTSHSLNEAARHAANLLKCYRRLSQNRKDILLASGCVTPAQIEQLISVLSEDSGDLVAFAGRFSRKGGQNPAAHHIAEAVRRIFRRQRRPIKFGQHPEGGPSTDFGRSVEHAIGAFGVRSDWRRPAEAAIKKNLEMENRLHRCAYAKFQREGFKLSPPLDLSDLKIEPRRASNGQNFILSIPSRPDIAPLSVAATMFKSGRELQEWAVGWAERSKAHGRNTN
jgi:hypothetical protein